MSILEIVPPSNFWHAGDLSHHDVSEDPRQDEYSISELDLDLRACELVRPAAVLWCAIYALLAKKNDKDCRLLVPDNQGTATYLKSVGLYTVLKEAGVDVDDRGLANQRDTKIPLPLHHFKSETEVEALTNDTLMRLSESGLGAASIRPFVTDVFAELAMNAIQHAESPIDAYGMIQFYEQEHGDRFICVVADGGIGIRRSLERNPEFRRKVPYDWTAIELASKERISTFTDQTRGLGLAWISDEMQKPGRQLIIHSGLGAMTINDDEFKAQANRVTLFPGTLVFASIAT